MNITPEPIAESDLFDVMLSAVETGLGYAVMPKADFSDFRGDQGVAITQIESPSISLPAWAPRRKRH